MCFLKKTESIRQISVETQVAFVFHGRGPLRLGHRISGRPVVFRANVQWPKALQRAGRLQRDHEKIADRDQRNVHQRAVRL